jgi:hypothetical protein
LCGFVLLWIFLCEVRSGVVLTHLLCIGCST